MSNFQTGIYCHYRSGNLYFASEVREDHNTGDLWVSYDALYPGITRGFTKRLGQFFASVPDADNKPVKRFTLVQELPVEKMQMLLPGTKVLLAARMDKEFTSNSVYMLGNGSIYVEIPELLTIVPLDEFFEEFLISKR